MSDLQTFVEIVEAGGLTAAANRKGVTQPALSRLLRDIETLLQAQLLRRTGRGIELTAAGNDFLRFSTETLERYETTRRIIREREKAFPRHLRLSVPLRVGGLLIPDLHRAFSDVSPETTVHVFEETSERAREMLADGRLDAALTYRSGSGADLGFTPLFKEDLYAVGNANSFGTDQDTIALNALGKLPLLLPSTGRYRDLIQSAFRSAACDLKVARELETAEGLLAFAAEGEGIAILPMSNVYKEVARGEVMARLIVNPGISRQIGVLFSGGIPKHTAGLVLSTIRKTMRHSRQPAAWQNLNAN
ncbi:MAG: LysR family transcriptional regulator [Pseudomonadota bacterium]